MEDSVNLSLEYSAACDGAYAGEDIEVTQNERKSSRIEAASKRSMNKRAQSGGNRPVSVERAGISE